MRGTLWTVRLHRGCPPPPDPRKVLEMGGGEVWDPKVVYQKWPNQIFPRVNFVFVPRRSLWSGREENCFAGGGWHGSPFAQPPLPLLGRRAGRGVWAGAAPPAVPGGGGPTPTYMAQNDPHVALIILTTHMWGKFLSEKNFSGPKFVFRRLWWQHPSLHKGPGTEAHFWNPPPPSPGAHAIPPPQSNFRAALGGGGSRGG